MLIADSRRTFAYSYNLEGELTAYAGPGGDVEYSYDETHQLTGATGDRTRRVSVACSWVSWKLTLGAMRKSAWHALQRIAEKSLEAA